MGWGPALGAAAILLAACGSGSTETTRTAETTQTTQSGQTPGPDAPADTTTDAAQPAGQDAPVEEPGAAVPEFLDFTAETVRGEQVSGADYAGQDLVLWFWAPW